jgi:hypothetical protein
MEYMELIIIEYSEKPEKEVIIKDGLIICYTKKPFIFYKVFIKGDEDNFIVTTERSFEADVNNFLKNEIQRITF